MGTSHTLKDIHRQLSPLGFHCTESQINVPSWRDSMIAKNGQILPRKCVVFLGLKPLNQKISEAMVINHDPKWTTIKKIQFEATNLG